MKKNKQTLLKAITIFMLLFSASFLKAQTHPGIMPYPSLEGGQVMTISESDDLWEDAMEVSAQHQAAANETLNEGGSPVNVVSCNNVICCSTLYGPCPDNTHSGHWYTTCVTIATGRMIQYQNW